MDVRALCVPQGAPQPPQKESGPLETSTHRIMRDKFDTLGVHCLFLFAMHLARRVKTSALLSGDV